MESGITITHKTKIPTTIIFTMNDCRDNHRFFTDTYHERTKRKCLHLVGILLLQVVNEVNQQTSLLVQLHLWVDGVVLDVLSQHELTRSK